jgi:hypothetical protein
MVRGTVFAGNFFAGKFFAGRFFARLIARYMPLEHFGILKELSTFPLFEQ